MALRKYFLVGVLLLFGPLLVTHGETNSISEEADLSEATISFSVTLLKALSEVAYENVVFSPSSIDVLLSLLQQGADGATLQQLSVALDRDPIKSRNGYPMFLQSIAEESKGNVHVKMATKVYLQNNFTVKEAFLKIAQEDFRTDVEALDFKDPESLSLINQWVSNATDGRISEMIKRGMLNADAIMVLVSAVFFNGRWQYPFLRGLASEGAFYVNPNTSIQVPFMAQSKVLLGGEDKLTGFKWVELPYQGGIFCMYLFLPLEDHGLDDALRKLTTQGVKQIFEQKEERYVKLRLPKFTLRQMIPLEDSLTRVGLEDLFNDNANLTGITSDNIKVSKVFQECYLKVDEDGTQAAASTVALATTLSLQWHQQEELKFFATQPFLLTIIDKVHKIPLFMAKVVNPR